MIRNKNKKNNQPPFSNFISIISSSKRKQEFIENIKKNLNKNFNKIIVYGPALIEKK